jgi:hypothetical protein
LLPFSGRADRLALLKRFNPPPTLVDWAREERGVNALADHVLGKFIDWRIEKNQLPIDLEAIEAAYRNWIRDEPRFAAGHNVRSSPKRPGRSRLSESALNRARAYDG